jgi:replication factor C subunit 1
LEFFYLFIPTADDGWEKKVCLLVGPPGVGKTTTVHLVCKELGFSVVEFNASDTRSASSLQEHVASLLRNTTVTQFYKKESATGADAAKSTFQALVMDEVDGMGGADRGGLAQLIQCVP